MEMKHRVTNKQPNSRMCLVCGMSNPLGLKAFFYETDQREVIAVFQPREEHQSYPNRLHGGIASAILDETIGRAVMHGLEEAVWGVTVELVTRFRKPIPLDRELRVVGRITRDRRRFFEGTGEIVLADGSVAVTAEGKYLKQPLASITDEAFKDSEWWVVRSQHDPEAFDIP